MTDPFPEALVTNTRVMAVKHHSRVKNMVPFAVKELTVASPGESKRLLFRSECRASARLVSIVEVVKRELLPASTYQWTRFYTEKTPTPVLVADGLPIGDEFKKTTYFEILLSTVPFTEKADSQQCSTDEFGSALPAPPKTVPPVPVKRKMYISAGKEIPTAKRTNNDGMIAALLPNVKTRDWADPMQCPPPTDERTLSKGNKFMRKKRKAT
uniref:UBX domain-containing protein n=1 Tax=Panagrellus redivivus TaxID=6233 RepID=A0A7E4VUP3_PANRE